MVYAWCQNTHKTATPKFFLSNSAYLQTKTVTNPHIMTTPDHKTTTPGHRKTVDNRAQPCYYVTTPPHYVTTRTHHTTPQPMEQTLCQVHTCHSG